MLRFLVWAFLAGSGEITAVSPDLIRCQIADKGLALLDQEYGTLIHLLEVIGCKEEPVLKISSQLLHVRYNGLYKFRLFLCGDFVSQNAG